MKKKIVVRFKGGLGNQLFQYAVGFALSKKYCRPLFFDDFSLVISHPNNTPRNFQLEHLSINYPYINLFEKFLFLFLSIFFKNFLTNDLNIKNLSCNNNLIVLNGYFQDYSLFDQYRKEIISGLNFTSSNLAFKLLTNQISKNENPLALHIRRGDYVSNLSANIFHGTLNLDYYYSAIKTLSKNEIIDNIYIFSDDIEWVKNNFQGDSRIVYVDDKFLLTDIESLIAMSRCKSFIIANSSFSWWAAYLGIHPLKKVIYPKNWNINNCPPNSPADWICL